MVVGKQPTTAQHEVHKQSMKEEHDPNTHSGEQSTSCGLAAVTQLQLRHGSVDIHMIYPGVKHVENVDMNPLN